MCVKRSSVNAYLHGRLVRVDACIRLEIEELNRQGFMTVGSCCGHGIYPKTILIKRRGQTILLNPETVIPRTRNLYRKDDDGYYFIPEAA